MQSSVDQYYGYWCLGAKVPEHHHSQHWFHIFSHEMFVYNHYFWLEQKWGLRLILRKKYFLNGMRNTVALELYIMLEQSHPTPLLEKDIQFVHLFGFMKQLLRFVYLRTLVPKASTVYQAGIRNCIPQYSVRSNYLSMLDIPASSSTVLIWKE